MKHNKKLLSLLLFIIAGEAIFTGLLPLSRGALFSLLASKTAAGIWMAVFFYFMTYFTIDLFQSIKGYVGLKLALWYRVARTKSVCAASNIHNTKELNVPQRVQESIKLSYVSRIEVYAEYLISGLILIQLFLLNFDVPILLACAIGYAALSVIIAIKFNPRLSHAEIISQQAEASFRESLTENITDIALLNPTNKVIMKTAKIRLEYLLFTKLQLGLVTVLPYIILIPELLDGRIDLGILVSHQATFALIVVNAAILIQMFPKLITGNASEQRVKEIE